VWDSTTGLPKPDPGTDVYPEAMAGVVAVTGPGAATAATTSVAVPGDHFSPAYLTVPAGTTVTWTNTDTDPHMVSTAPGLAPVSFNLPLAAGATASYTFTTPGLYVYYCPMHAVWDSTTGLPKPDPGTDVYPEAMAGVVFVVGAQ
jgi:plastocyanin